MPDFYLLLVGSLIGQRILMSWYDKDANADFISRKECLSLGIRLDFMTPQGLRCHYVQKMTDNPWSTGNIPMSYIEASALVAALRGRVYNNPSPWRKIVPPLRVISVDFNNLSQKYDITERQNVTNVPEPTERTVAENRAVLQNAGLNMIKRGNLAWAGCDYCRVSKFKWSTELS